MKITIEMIFYDISFKLDDSLVDKNSNYKREWKKEENAALEKNSL